MISDRTPTSHAFAVFLVEKTSNSYLLGVRRNTGIYSEIGYSMHLGTVPPFDWKFANKRWEPPPGGCRNPLP